MANGNIPIALALITIGAVIIYALQDMPTQPKRSTTKWTPPERSTPLVDTTPSYCETHPDACGGNSRTTNLDAALAELKQEPKIKDVHVDSFYVYVGVLDDKTDRTGYAMYVCEVLRSHNVDHVEGYTVKILDVVKASRDNKTSLLGKYRCK